jgi:hypothetical protein
VGLATSLAKALDYFEKLAFEGELTAIRALIISFIVRIAPLTTSGLPECSTF